jgi:hypothetical protein
MILKSKQFNHAEESFHTALNIDKHTVIMCRERIFFTHFANTLQSLELFSDRDDAPKEMTTVTGDLQRTLSMISDPVEYELTLLHFMNYHRMATGAFSMWRFQNDPANSKEDKLKLELLKLVTRLKDLKDQEDEEEEINNNLEELTPETVSQRVDLVKKSNFDFNKYMDLVGHPVRSSNHRDVDDILKGLFDQNGDF